MVGVFRRSSTLPGPNPNPKEKSYHVRSVSLPCRPHPVLSQLRQEITAVRSWQSAEATSAHLPAGLSLLRNLHAALDELLQLPTTHEALRPHRRSPSATGLPEDFLRLADAFRCFLEALVAMQQLHSEARLAVRRRDEKALAASARAQRKAGREIAGLAAEMRGLGRSAQEPAAPGDAELVGVLTEAVAVAASASAAIFAGFAALSTASCSSSSPASGGWAVLRRRTKGSETAEEWWKRRQEAVRALEECNLALESGSEKVGEINLVLFYVRNGR